MPNGTGPFTVQGGGNFKVPTSPNTEMINNLLARNLQRAQQQSGLTGQLSLLRTLKTLGLMNGFTDPTTGEFVRTPGQKLTEKQQKEFLDQKHQREAREAIWNNAALFERLQQANTLSAEKRLKHLQDIKKNDIEPIAQKFGVKANDVYKSMFGELEQQYAKAQKEVEESRGLGTALTEAGLAFRDLWEAGKSVVSDWSDKERIESAKKWNQERQAIVESNPYLADQAKRQAEGEGYFERMGGKTGSLLNPVSTAAGLAPYVLGTLGGSLLGGPYGAFAVPFAMGAAQGSFGMAQRAAGDPNLTPAQQEAAVSTIPRLTAGAASGTLSALPLNLGKVAGFLGRPMARKALQASMPQASAETVARELPEYMAAQSAYRASQQPIRNALTQGAMTVGAAEAMTAGDVIARNAIYNAATGSDASVFEGLGEAVAQGLVAAAPLGVMHYFQRPRMPESYRLGKDGAVRKLSVDEYAERVRTQYKEDPTNTAAMTSIFAAARDDLGVNSFQGLMGRVLNHPDMKSLSPETVNQWNRLYNAGRSGMTRTATGEGRNVENDLIPGDPAAATKSSNGKPERTEYQNMQSMISSLLRQKTQLNKTAQRVMREEPEAGQAGVLEAQAHHLNNTVLTKALDVLGGIDESTIPPALNKIEAYLNSLPTNTNIAPLVNMLKQAVVVRRSMIKPEPVVETIVDANGQVKGAASARPEQQPGVVDGNGQKAATGADTPDTTIPRGVASHPEGDATTAPDGTSVQNTRVSPTTEGGGAGGAETPNGRASQSVDVSGQEAGTPAAEQRAVPGRGTGKVSGDETAGNGAGKPTDKGLGDENGGKPSESTSGRVIDDTFEIRPTEAVEVRSPDVEFKRLNDLINMKNELMFSGAVGGYKGSGSVSAKRQYVAELMEGLYRTALEPDKLLPSQLRWKVSKYLVANKGINPMSEGMAEGIHKLWNNADGISEREYLLNTLRDPDEQRRSILENVKCQMIVALRTAK